MITGQPRDFYKKFKFVVQIDNVNYAGFQKCSALEAEISKVTHREGGTLIADQSPGLVNFTDVTLERGATDDHDLWDWFEQGANVVANTGVASPNHERNLDIVQQNRDGTERKRWRVVRAWPTKFVAGEWDNDADENVIEKITLTFFYFHPVT